MAIGTLEGRLILFIRARLDDDEAYARNAFGEHNDAVAEWTEIWSGAVHLGPNDDLLLTNDSQISRHIVRHDPARVLRDVQATRRIMDHWLETEGWGTHDPYYLQLIASRWDDHDDYDPAWTPDT